MQYRSLGASGLNVPVLGLGAANFRNDTNPALAISDRVATRLVDLAIDRGANFIDASHANTEVHALLANILGKRRSQVVITAGAGLRCGDGPNDAGASRHNLTNACEQNLRRLGTDYLDLLLIQNFDVRTPLEETLSTLDSLIRAGKVRYVGCSNFAGWQLMKGLAVADRNGWPRFVSHQFTYSLASRGCEGEVLPVGLDQNVAGLARGGLAGGILAGNYGRSGAMPVTAQGRAAAMAALPQLQLSAVIDSLGEISRELDVSKAQVALAWLLQRPTVASVSVGASCAEQLEANLAAIDLHLTGDQLARLDEISEPRTHAQPRHHAVEGLEQQATVQTASIEQALMPVL